MIFKIQMKIITVRRIMHHLCSTLLAGNFSVPKLSWLNCASQQQLSQFAFLFGAALPMVSTDGLRFGRFWQLAFVQLLEHVPEVYALVFHLLFHLLFLLFSLFHLALLHASFCKFKKIITLRLSQ